MTRTGAWTAILAATFTSTAMIDPIMAKGEILGIPFVMASFYLALRALTRQRIDVRALVLAFGAGVTAVLAQGMKQNLVSGLVFGAALLIGSRLTHRITPNEFLRLAGAALVGAAVPVAGTILWAMQAGVELDTLWYAVYGFRSDGARRDRELGQERPPPARPAAARHRAGHRRRVHPRRRPRPPAADLAVQPDPHGGGRPRGHRRRAGAAARRELLAAVPVRDRPGRGALHRAAAGRPRQGRAAGAHPGRGGRRGVRARHRDLDDHRPGRPGRLRRVPGRRRPRPGSRAGRHDRRLRRSRRDRARQRDVVAVRTPLEPADAHARPRPDGAEGGAERPERPDLVRVVGAGLGLGRPGRGARAGAR